MSKSSVGFIDVFSQICENLRCGPVAFSGKVPQFTGKVDNFMLYIHYCENCDRIHILNGHKTSCPKCDSLLCELPVSFLEYTKKDADERQRLVAQHHCS